MEKTNLLTLVVTLTVGIILAGSLLMPVISDATETTDTFENTGYFSMTKYDTETDLTIEWDHTKPKVITINEEDIALEGFPLNQWISIIIGDDWMVRYANGGTLYFSQLRYGNMQTMSADTNTGTDMTIVCEAGTATATRYTSGTPGTPAEVSYTEIYAISERGDYVMKKATDIAYMAGDSPIVAYGTTDLGSGYSSMIKITGTINDGVDVTILASTSGSAAIVDDSIVINKTATTSTIGYELSNIQFEISDRGDDYPATYSYFIVPAKVTLELTEHLSNGEIAIMNAIPLMIIVALVMMAAGSLYLKRDD